MLVRALQEGSESGGEARKNDYVEYDADFIDDTEVFDYYGGDRRKTKHSGFFINKARSCSLSSRCPQLVSARQHLTSSAQSR